MAINKEVIKIFHFCPPPTPLLEEKEMTYSQIGWGEKFSKEIKTYIAFHCKICKLLQIQIKSPGQIDALNMTRKISKIQYEYHTKRSSDSLAQDKFKDHWTLLSFQFTYVLYRYVCAYPHTHGYSINTCMSEEFIHILTAVSCY